MNTKAEMRKRERVRVLGARREVLEPRQANQGQNSAFLLALDLGERGDMLRR